MNRDNSKVAPILTLIAAYALVPLCAQAIRDGQSITSPMPSILVIGLFLSVPYFLIIGAPSAAFVFWCYPLFRGEPISSKRTLIAFVTVTVLSAVAFCVSWRYGVQYEGAFFTRVTALISMASALLIAAILVWSRRTRSQIASLAANFLLFAWIFTYAFPYLGEWP